MNTTELSKQVVNLFWTGGWDSTFRLLQLLDESSVVIQPYYIVFTGRPSSLKELSTIGEIRRLASERYSGVDARLLPTRIISRHEIPTLRKNAERIDRLRSHTKMGRQYRTLADFSEWFGMSDLELCIHKTGLDDDIAGLLTRRVVECRSPDALPNFRLGNLVPGEDLELFAPFCFPTLQYTKKAMLEIARSKGFLDLLTKSWFCHYPIEGKPCGLCSPCEQVIESGMEWRVGRDGLFRHRFLPVYMLMDRYRSRRPTV